MKFDWQHLMLMLGAPAAIAFCDYLVNSPDPFSKATLQHAAVATVLVVIALAKKSFLPGGVA